MKLLVGGNHFFSFSVDLEKNRQYLVLRGYWEDVTIGDDFLKYNQQSIDMLQPGFTTLIDISELELNDKIFVKDVALPVGEIVSDPETLVLNIKPSALAVEEEEEEVEGEEGEEGAEGAEGDEGSEGDGEDSKDKED